MLKKDKGISLTEAALLRLARNYFEAGWRRACVTGGAIEREDDWQEHWADKDKKYFEDICKSLGLLNDK